MDLTVANIVIGTELDSPAAKHTETSNENFLRVEAIIEDNNSNNNNTSSSSNNNSSIIKIVNQEQDLCNYQIYNMQEKEDIVLLNSITSEYQRRKKMLEEEINKQKTALVTSAKERKTNLKQAYNAAYRAMNNAKLHAYQQLTSPKSDETLNDNDADDDNQEELEKISKKLEAEQLTTLKSEEKSKKKREVNRLGYLRKKELLAEKKTSISEDQATKKLMAFDPNPESEQDANEEEKLKDDKKIKKKRKVDSVGVEDDSEEVAAGSSDTMEGVIGGEKGGFPVTGPQVAVSRSELDSDHQQEHVDEQKYRLQVNETLPLELEQLITLKSEEVVTNETEENKRIRKQEIEHLKYLRKKERLAEKKASMSEEQKLEVLERQREAKRKYYAQKKAHMSSC